MEYVHVPLACQMDGLSSCDNYLKKSPIESAPGLK